MSDTNETTSAAAGGRESIDHIRELLVGTFVRTLNEQIDELKSASKRSEMSLRDGVEELERKIARNVSDIRDQFNRQVETLQERFTQRLETVSNTQGSRTNELEDRVAEAVQSMEAIDKHIREEFASRLEEVLMQARDQSGKLASTLNAKTGYLETRITQQRDAVDEELETIRRNIDKRIVQIQEEIKSSMGFISDELKRAIHESAESLKTEINEGLDQQNRRINALKNDADDFERRFRAEFEQKANDISSRINKRLDAMDTTLANRVQDVENRFSQLQERMQERQAHAQTALEGMQKEMKGMRDTMGSMIDERLRVMRDDMEKRKADREDIGNILIEIGMRFRKEAGAPELMMGEADAVSSLGLLEAMVSGVTTESEKNASGHEKSDAFQVTVEPSAASSRNGDAH